MAEEVLRHTKITQGLFLILVGLAPAPVWEIRPKHHLERQKPMPYVNHYSFHILDPDWGHLTIKISGHPPFPAQILLNGHEYVACQARRAGIHFINDDLGQACGVGNRSKTIALQTPCPILGL